MPVTVTDVAWSACVQVQHRLADSYRLGRLFLAGDAAHTHSPAAAQGRNTGIVDGINLGWKLAFAAAAGGGSELLSSYEHERRHVARQVMALTNLVFAAEASTRLLPQLLRGTLVPAAGLALPLVLRQRTLMAAVVGVLSQRWVHYRHSVLSVDAAPSNTWGPARVTGCRTGS
jgi:2-polyprenyl-6-methoxyphenol hydroxylase-like FAD-dependent oxidoreductase